MLLYAIAFLAGIVTAISPCVYPVLPIIFAGGASGGRRRPYAIIAGLVVTFVLSLLFVGWLLDRIGLSQDFLRKVSIGFLLLFAATLVIPPLARAIERPLLRFSRRPSGDLGGGFLLGASLGLLFVPCGGPVLGFITTQTASLAGGRRVGLAVAYALGAALPMLLLALGGQRAAGRIRGLSLQSPAARAVLGGVMAVSALLIAFDVDKKLQTRIGDYTPWLQKAERSCYTRKQLGQRCLTSAQPASSALKDYGPAPDFTGISTWINSKPVTVSELRGKVVLVDFWTYSCINCLRTLPHLKAWDAAYRKAGLRIVGVHTPEFAFEHVPSNVRKATRELGVRYAVAIDNDYKTWDAYQNGAWPTEYLVDRRGHIREIKEGEGNYDDTERTIRKLLGEPAKAQLASVADQTPRHVAMTPETYLGWERLERYSGSQLVPDRVVPYKFPRTVPPNTVAYDGLWKVERQRIVAAERARLRLGFLAQNVYLVLGGKGSLRVLVDGKPVRTIQVGGLSRLYTLLQYPKLHEGELELRFAPGVTAYAFTFG
jgi:cytochrome c biogenesis protein CcdA/thiol-disulfide isomerase/thioredoxin